RDRGELLARFAVPRDADDVVTELLGIGSGHGPRPSLQHSQRHRSCEAYPRVSPQLPPVRCAGQARLGPASSNCAYATSSRTKSSSREVRPRQTLEALKEI